jgi:hypothetical protein
MVDLPRRIFKGSGDSLRFQRRIIVQDCRAAGRSATCAREWKLAGRRSLMGPIFQLRDPRLQFEQELYQRPQLLAHDAVAFQRRPRLDNRIVDLAHL